MNPLLTLIMARPKGFDSRTAVLGHSQGKTVHRTVFLTLLLLRIPRTEKNQHSTPKRELLIWPARRDSNPRPSESESAAISSFATGGKHNYYKR